MASKTTRAKFMCNDIVYRKTREGDISSETVRLSAVYSSNPNSENHHFWQATPIGNLEMTINNSEAFGSFELGKDYYLDFTPVEISEHK